MNLGLDFEPYWRLTDDYKQDHYAFVVAVVFAVLD